MSNEELDDFIKSLKNEHSISGERGKSQKGISSEMEII